jgi:hypothetical protein
MFWSVRIEADHADPQKLWRSVDVLISRSRPPVGSSISIGSVAHVRASTSGVPPPSYSRVWLGMSFQVLTPLSTKDVLGAIHRQ